MSSLVVLVGLFVLFGAGLAFIAFLAYRRALRHAKGIERGLKMVPMLIHLPPPSDDTESGSRPLQEVMREKVNQAQVLYDLIAGTAQGGFKSNFYGQRHIAFEIVASNGLVHYFAAVPIALVEVVEQAIVTAYPGARLEEVEDHNIFNPQGRLTATVGGELVLKHEAAYPIGIIDTMERDPMEALINSLYKLQLGDGAAVQVMLRPARPNWVKRSIKLVAQKRHTRQGGMGFGVADIAKGAIKAPETQAQDAAKFEPSKLEEQMLQAIEDKTKHPGYEVLVRVLASSSNYARSQIVLRNLVNAFSLFEAPGSNGFQFIEARDIQGLVTAFIFRFFPPELVSTVLNSVELAALFHLPDAQFTTTTQVERQQSKQVDGPINMPATGLLMGYNFYRGVKKEIRLSPEDRRRHAYIVGQTGTGKSTMLENLAVQDMLAGNGFAFIDPHGDAAERLLSMVPKERAEDVVYFNPGDMEHPLGLNIFEYATPEQKDFLIQESLNMLYKLYDPGKTGIIGPRFEHWYRNAALTLMADPHGASFIELPKVFTDATYLKNKFKFLKDPTVIDFWTKEMAQTSDYHKSEMLGWFVSKFGAFQTNEMMRNIIGQTHSSFDLRDIMDNKKMLIVNLSKGRVGELNSQLLGMIFVIKIQAAAMSRANVPEDQRPDFCLYVDEFQNFSTDSFAAILSEARKYRLNLIVANQFIGQLTEEIRDAVFGNIGTILSYRTGPEDAEFLVKQFEPIFDERDLVNLPNHNAIMKLLIGGLPSQPFSITALPPLGVAHPEMGVAIQQLSAAKYGTTRSVVEADIFGRLQNQPTTVVPNAATAHLQPPVAPPPPSPPSSTPRPVAPPLAAPPAVPMAPIVEPQPPAPVPAPNHAALLPTPIATPAPVTAGVGAGGSTSAPPPPPPKQAAPVAADALALSQLRQAAKPLPETIAPAVPPPPPSKPTSGGIADIVKMPPRPPRQVALPAPPLELQIEAHEADGYTGSAPVPPPKPVEPPAPKPKVAPPPPPPAPQPQPKPPAPPPPAPKPTPIPPPKPAAPLPKPKETKPMPPSQPPKLPESPKPAPVPAATPPPARPAPVRPPELAPQPPVAPPPPPSPPPPPPPKPAPVPPPKPVEPPAPMPKVAPPPPAVPMAPLVEPPPPAPVPAPEPAPQPAPMPTPAPPRSADEPILPPDVMASAHIELHHQGRASENPFSETAQKALAGQPEVETPPPAPEPVKSATIVNDAYAEAAAPKTPTPQVVDIQLDDTLPPAPLPQPGEVVAPRASTPPEPPEPAQSPPVAPPVPKPAPQIITPPPPSPPTPKPAPPSPPPKLQPAPAPKPPTPKPPEPLKHAKKSVSPPPKPKETQPMPTPLKPEPKPEPKPSEPPKAPTPAPEPPPPPVPPQPVAPEISSTPNEPAKPNLQPGEVYVDENGEVIQG